MESPKTFCHREDKKQLIHKLSRLESWIRDISGPVALGFSGGVDSAFLLVSLVKWCRFSVTPFMAVSPFLSERERESALKVTGEIGINVTQVTWDPLAEPLIVENGPLRCYYCKKSMYCLICRAAKDIGSRLVFDGTQWDDLKRDRPGLRALHELDIKTPLASLGFKKNEIRSVLMEWGFSFSDRKAESCLATRIARNTKISEENLEKIGKIEKYFEHIGLKFIKLKIIDNLAYVFMNADEMARFKMHFGEIKRIGEGFTFVLKN